MYYVNTRTNTLLEPKQKSNPRFGKRIVNALTLWMNWTIYSNRKTFYDLSFCSISSVCANSEAECCLFLSCRRWNERSLFRHLIVINMESHPPWRGCRSFSTISILFLKFHRRTLSTLWPGECRPQFIVAITSMLTDRKQLFSTRRCRWNLRSHFLIFPFGYWNEKQ